MKEGILYCRILITLYIYILILTLQWGLEFLLHAYFLEFKILEQSCSLLLSPVIRLKGLFEIDTSFCHDVFVKFCVNQ